MRTFHGGEAKLLAVLNMRRLIRDCGIQRLFTRLSFKALSVDGVPILFPGKQYEQCKFQLTAWHFLRRRRLEVMMPAVRLGDIRRTAGLQEDRRKAEIVERYLMGKDALALAREYGVRRFWQKKGGVSPSLIRRWVKEIAGLTPEVRNRLPKIQIGAQGYSWPAAVDYLRHWARGKDWPYMVWPYRPEKLATRRELERCSFAGPIREDWEAVGRDIEQAIADFNLACVDIPLGA